MAIACMFPDDPDGNAFCSAWPAFAGPAGYTLVAPPAYPAYPAGLTNYSAFISGFKGKNCEFFTNVQLPRRPARSSPPRSPPPPARHGCNRCPTTASSKWPTRP